MANHKSAEKRARQSEIKRARNKSCLSGTRNAVKAFKTAVSQLQAGKGDLANAQSLFQQAQSALQKAVGKGILHRNNVARRIGRLSKSLRAAQTPADSSSK